MPVCIGTWRRKKQSESKSLQCKANERTRRSALHFCPTLSRERMSTSHSSVLLSCFTPSLSFYCTYAKAWPDARGGDAWAPGASLVFLDERLFAQFHFNRNETTVVRFSITANAPTGAKRKKRPEY